MKTYRKERKKYLMSVERAYKSGKFHVFVLGIVALVILGYLLNFTMNTKIRNAQAARKYVVNYSEQRGFMLEKEISSGKMLMSSLKESIECIENPDLQDFLDRKKNIYKFDFIVLYDTDTGEQIAAGTVPEELRLETVKEYMTAQSKEERGECTASVENETIVYAVQIQSPEKTSEILLAGSGTDEIRDMITTESFKRKSSSFIIDGDHNILISSKTEDRSNLWDYLLHQKKDQKLAAEEEEMEQNLKAGKSGVLSFESDELEQYYLAYTPTDIQGWSVITVVPSDFLAGISDQYIVKILGSLLGTLLLFGIYSLLILRSHEKQGKQLEKLAFLDHVTGGINKIEFRLRYEELCRKKTADQYVIVLLDSVDFRMINESFGVNKGDEMLRHFYKVVIQKLRESEGEFASRTDMDHIFICLKERDPVRIQKRMEEIIEKINDFHGTTLPQCRVDFKVGASFIEDNATEITTIQDHARVVLKLNGTAKNNTCIFYDSVIEQKVKKERELDNLFETAIEGGEFQVYMQPQVSLTKRNIAGAEALVRWNRPGMGMIPPDEFIPILERNGKICILDLYIFERVCCWLKDRKDQGKQIIPVAVNLSRSNFQDVEFVDCFAVIAEKYDVEKTWIEFEVTETLFLDEANLENVREGIEKIHRYGFRCAIDDFGVGFSSLTMLRKFDIDVLKLDRAFFLDLSSKKARNVVQCIADLAKSLDIVLVAEGIETEEQIEFLETLNCDVVQGYYFSRPLPTDEFEKWMQEFESMDFLKDTVLTTEKRKIPGGGYTDAEDTRTDQTIL